MLVVAMTDTPLSTGSSTVSPSLLTVVSPSDQAASVAAAASAAMVRRVRIILVMLE